MRRVVGLLFAGLTLAGAQQPPAASPDLNVRIAAIRSFVAAEGDRIWPGYGTAPFDMLLISQDRETLLCRHNVPQGFTADGQDAATGCARSVRPRGNFSPGLLAAMPIFGPPATIVMGTPQATGLSPERWSATILHEHFHQWQWSLPDYWSRVAALDLAGGDTTGMWMLNFEFPYDRPDVTAAFRRAVPALMAAVEARGRSSFRRRLRSYLAARRALAATAGERNWRYLELQLWQEGVARWSEIQLARRHPEAAMRQEAEARERETLRALPQADLAEQKRVIAYSYGTAEAMLLEACGAQWRTEYRQVLALGPLLETAARRCRS